MSNRISQNPKQLGRLQPQSFSSTTSIQAEPPSSASASPKTLLPPATQAVHGQCPSTNMKDFQALFDYLKHQTEKTHHTTENAMQHIKDAQNTQLIAELRNIRQTMAHCQASSPSCPLRAEQPRVGVEAPLPVVEVPPRPVVEVPPPVAESPPPVVEVPAGDSGGGKGSH